MIIFFKGVYGVMHIFFEGVLHYPIFNVLPVRLGLVFYAFRML